jgi:hypothetical protein
MQRFDPRHGIGNYVEIRWRIGAGSVVEVITAAACRSFRAAAWRAFDAAALRGAAAGGEQGGQ